MTVTQYLFFKLDIALFYRGTLVSSKLLVSNLYGVPKTLKVFVRVTDSSRGHMVLVYVRSQH